MAKIVEFDAAQMKEWEDWLAARPPVVQELARRLPVFNLYRIKDTGQRVVIVAYAEDGTLHVEVLAKFNPENPMLVIFGELRVFGIKPGDMEECDIPTEKPVVSGGWVIIQEGQPGPDSEGPQEEGPILH